jgi:predicted O-methyltransferase YrrM/predicted SAM-dependent methyltransferase
LSAVDDTSRSAAGLRTLERDDDSKVRSIGRAIRRIIEDDLDPGERGWVAAIEELRGRLDTSTEEIDTALANHRDVTKPMSLGEVATRRSKKGPWASLLLTLGRETRPARTLELGTCLGVSGAFLAAATHLNGSGTLTTLEGAPALAARAQDNLASLGLKGAEVVPGLFRDTLEGVLADTEPIGLTFIDGHHDEVATQEYFDQILPRLEDGAVVVFDDIAWSEGMAVAWQALRNHPAVRVAVDLDKVGICLVGSGDRSLLIELPSLSLMASEARRAARPAPRRAEPRAVDLEALSIPRLNWGCGHRGEPDWINNDTKSGPGIQLVGDIRDGLALPDECLDYVVSIHTLPMIPIPDLVPVLQELRRVLKPGGVLRLGLPDLEKGLDAWRRDDRSYFLVPDDDARTMSGKVITQLLWYGYSVTLFTEEWIEEVLDRAGYRDITHCAHGRSDSGLAEITALDNREHESLFVEATR